MAARMLSPIGAIHLTQGEHDHAGDSCVSLRARVPPSRASHRAAGGRFARATVWLPATAGNLTQMDTPLAHKHETAFASYRMTAKHHGCRRSWSRSPTGRLELCSFPCNGQPRPGPRAAPPAPGPGTRLVLSAIESPPRALLLCDEGMSADRRSGARYRPLCGAPRQLPRPLGRPPTHRQLHQPPRTATNAVMSDFTELWSEPVLERESDC
jgi:hypothetical protein